MARMSRMSRRRFVATSAGAAAGLAVGAKIVAGNSTAQAATDPYAQMFLDQYNKIKDPNNGYFHSSGVPYHSVEKLMVEAPDHGHESTSEAMSYLIWLEAVYGRVTGDWSRFNAAWATAEKYIIPTHADQPSNDSYNPSSPATYAPEFPDVTSYPSPLNSSAASGQDPIAGELKSAYGTSDIYGMHWLLDVDNVYGYGGTAGTGGEAGPSAPGPCYINSYQRGSQESVWETIPQPCTDLFNYGGPNGYLDLFIKDSSYAKQWKFTDAPDADARAIQAAYWALRWATAQGQASAVSSGVSKAVKMGDYLRYAMFDKYFKQIGNCIGATTCPAGSGRNSQHYLLGWYYAWGGAEPGGGWAWRIGDGACHHGYQNPVAAWALSTVSGMTPASATGKSDWATSLSRQIEFLTWLQSAEGGIAGGATNSWDGQYGTPPAGTPTFHGMFYDWEPVYHDPPSNNWFGMQAWGMERWAEYYYLTKDAKVRPILDKWVTWVSGLVTVGTGGDFSIPSTLSWSGAPDTWNPSSPGSNAGLHVSVADSGQDVGVAAALIKALFYYAAATGNTDAQTLGKNLLDAVATHTDTKGIAIPETRADYNRFDDPVFVPSGWTGTMPNGDPINSNSTFISIRSFYQSDPDYINKVQPYLNGGAVPTFTYHRFWAQADLAIAFATYSELFLSPGNPSASASATGIPSRSPSQSPSRSPSQSPSRSPSQSPSRSPSQSPSRSPSQSPTGSGRVTASYHIDSDWGVGFVATVTVTNGGSTPISSWRVTWTFGGNQRISNAWNTSWSQSGATFNGGNMPYNGTLAPGASTTFGFQASYSGTNSVPNLSASGS